MMRTSPCWTHRCHGLPQVAIHSQLSCHVALGFSRHVVTVSVITFSYDIETGRSWMRWKGDDDAVVLDLVPAPEGPWIILCDHGKVLRHLFALLHKRICAALHFCTPWRAPIFARCGKSHDLPRWAFLFTTAGTFARHGKSIYRGRHIKMPATVNTLFIVADIVRCPPR